MSDSPNKTNNKIIVVGSFYFIHDKSKSGHPGLIIKKDDLNNRYLVIRFDSDKPGEIPKYVRGIRHITKLSTPTDGKVINSYVRNRPYLCKRKDIGTKLLNFNVSQKDFPILKKVSLRTPEISSSLRKIKKSPR